MLATNAEFILRINFVNVWTSKNKISKNSQTFIFLTKYESYPQAEQIVVITDPISAKPQGF